MTFVCKQRPAPEEIGLELEVVGDEVRANLIAPPNTTSPLRLQKVPLRQAIVIAATLAWRLGTNVAVVDHRGLWPLRGQSDESGSR